MTISFQGVCIPCGESSKLWTDCEAKQKEPRSSNKTAGQHRDKLLLHRACPIAGEENMRRKSFSKLSASPRTPDVQVECVASHPTLMKQICSNMYLFPNGVIFKLKFVVCICHLDGWRCSRTQHPLRPRPRRLLPWEQLASGNPSYTKTGVT